MTIASDQGSLHVQVGMAGMASVAGVFLGGVISAGPGWLTAGMRP